MMKKRRGNQDLAAQGKGGVAVAPPKAKHAAGRRVGHSTLPRPTSLPSKSATIAEPRFAPTYQVQERPQAERSVAARFWYIPVLVAYAAMVGWAALQHCPWFDEAQAWLVARDCGLMTMFTEVLRREGHPALWYLILKCVQAFHLPYGAFNLFSGAIATAGVWILLAKSPFPKWFAALLPFTFYLGYQYAVIARSYVLLPLLFFALATFYRQKWERPVRWCVILALLANVSAHSFVIACGVMLVHCVELANCWRDLGKNARRAQIKAIAIFGAAALFAVVTTFPTKDCVTPNGFSGEMSFAALAKLTLMAIDHAMFECSFLTAVFLLASCYWFWRTGVLLLFAAVWLPVLLLFSMVRVAPQHEGILLVTWLFVFWRSLDRFASLRRNGDIERRWRMEWMAMMILAVGLAVRHDVWTGQTLAFERQHPYSGAPALAAYIKSHHLTEYRVAGVHAWITAVLPYFSNNFFVNFPNDRQYSFTSWRRSCCAFKKAFAADNALAEPCDIIIWPEQDVWVPPTPTEYKQMLARLPEEWRYVAHFDGRQIYRNHVTSCSGYAVFATRRVAEELGLANAEDGSLKLEDARPAIWNCTDFYWNVVRPVQFHADFSSLLRKISPKEAFRQSQFALEAAAHVDLKGVSDNDVEQLNTTVAIAHNNIGTTLSMTDPREAIDHYRASLKLDPANHKVYGNLAALLAKGGQLHEAADLLQKALEIAPDDARTKAMLQRIQLMMAAGKSG